MTGTGLSYRNILKTRVKELKMDTSMPWILSNLECEMEKEKGIMSPCFHHTEFG